MNWKGALSTTLLAVLSGYAGSQVRTAVAAAPDTISTQSFHLVDNQGRVRLAMAASDDSRAVALTFFEPETKTARVIVGIRPDRAGVVEFRDSTGNKCAEFIADSNGASRINILDQHRKGGLVLGSREGQTVLVFNDDQPAHRATIGINSAGVAALSFNGTDGKVIFVAPPGAGN